MAEAILFSIATEILKKLASTTLQQIDLATSVKRELKKLEETLSTVKAVLLDAEEKQSTNHQLHLWLEGLQNVLYDVDNLFDKLVYKALQQRLASHGNLKSKVRHMSNSVKFRFRMGYKIKEIRERLDQLSSNMAQFNLTERDVDYHVMPREMTYYVVNPSDVIGRDTDKNDIVDLLTCSHIDQNLSIVSIVGIGGLGKTTLAKLVYEDNRVNECFELKMWICVSHDFNLQKLTKGINESATEGDDYSRYSIDELQKRLRNSVKEKKFLLVLDDVWNENQHEWNNLRQFLVGGAKGSKILVTTRSLQVTSIMRSTETYNLKGLSNEDCWSLFAKFAFREGEEKNYLNLVKIGKDIIKKCKGVPLAVKSLGSMLFMKIDEHDWLTIYKSEVWELEEKENGILPALRLSYKQLPSHLKRCFAFCSMFSKDFKFDGKELIEMWMSQGFIQVSVESIELEEMGQIYINDLCSRCFFQDIRKFNDGVKFKMHDLVHDLALLVAQKDCHTIKNLPTIGTISETFRHVSLCIEEDIPVSFELDLRNLWTFYYFPNLRHKGANELFVRTCIPRFQFLRMLDMRRSSFEVLPESIGSLNHLRYLNMSNNIYLKKLPDAICKLLHLQTLDVFKCNSLKGMPRDIGNLINLRRLLVNITKIKLVLNKEIGLLTSLRDLRIGDCPNLVTSSDGHGLFPHLRSLTLENCVNVKCWPGIMKHLPALETLSIGYCSKLDLINDEFSFTSLRSLTFYALPQLKVLPEWVKRCYILEDLTIYVCSNITSLPNWIQNFTPLERLVIWGCPKISELPNGICYLALLTELIINACPLLNDRCKREGADWPKISHIRKIDVDGKEIPKRDDHDQGS